MTLVLHQHEASGATFEAFRRDYGQRLEKCATYKPVLINSHTGRDYFTLDQHLALIDTAQEVTDRTGIPIVHETHRGGMGYAPQAAGILFDHRPDLRITADFSHWTCVTESMLGNFSAIMQEAIQRTVHIHSRVGFEEGPQVGHPGAPEWDYALQKFTGWWDKITELHQQRDGQYL